MPESAREHAGIDFHAAIAQWRLALRTEVKRASSLPTAMFDACDPMLETRLAQSAEAMLSLLQEPAPEHRSDESRGEQRLESVSQAELAQLPAQIGATAPAAIDLAADQSAEYLGILADLCCQDGTGQRPAATRLCSDFGIASSHELDTLVQLLADQTAAAVTDTTAAPHGPAALLQTCAAVQAAMRRHGLLPQDRPV